MTIQAVSSHNVSFGHIKTTKKGNEYKKSHFATRTGVLTGLAAATGFGMATKRVFSNPSDKYYFAKKVLKFRNDQIAKGLSKNAATKVAKLIIPTAFGIVSAGFILSGLLVGAGINKIVNHIKAKNADKSADKQMTQTAETPKS